MRRLSNLLLGLIFLPVAMAQTDHVLSGQVVDTAGNPMPGVLVRSAEVYCNELDQCAMLVDLAYTPGAVSDEMGYFEIRTVEFPRNYSIGWVISYHEGEIPVPCYYSSMGDLALGWWTNNQVEVQAGTAVCPTLEELGW